jgi:hypothetical protein
MQAAVRNLLIRHGNLRSYVAKMVVRAVGRDGAAVDGQWRPARAVGRFCDDHQPDA